MPARVRRSQAGTLPMSTSIASAPMFRRPPCGPVPASVTPAFVTATGTVSNRILSFFCETRLSSSPTFFALPRANRVPRYEIVTVVPG